MRSGYRWRGALAALLVATGTAFAGCNITIVVDRPPASDATPAPVAIVEPQKADALTPPIAAVPTQAMAPPTAVPTTAPSPPTAAPRAEAAAPGDEASAVAALRPSLVRVRTDRAQGSGVVVRADGLIVTNAHVVEDSALVRAGLDDGRDVPATIVRTDVGRDLALLDVGIIGLRSARLADVDKRRLGEPVIALGYALGLSGDPTVTRGLYSARRPVDGVDHIQTDAAINPGNSGGPLASLNGEVVGINTWKLTQLRGQPVQGFNFAVSAQEVRALLAEYEGTQVQDAARARPTRPPPSATPARTDAAVAVRDYYRAIDAHELARAWSLLSSGFRSTTSYPVWAAGYDTTRSVRVSGAQTESQDAAGARVGLRLSTTDLLGGRLVDAVFAGTWSLVWEDGAWRLDRAVISRVTPSGAPDPVSVVTTYYARVDARDFAYAYAALISSRMRGDVPRTTFDGWFKNKTAIRAESVAARAVGPTEATVEATVVSTDVIDGRTVTARYREIWTLVREGDVWGMDAVETTRLSP
jgi:S1-C subfamily serine protease